MAEYHFVCRECDLRAMVTAPLGKVITPDCEHVGARVPMHRDYRAEGMTANLGELKLTREAGGTSGQANLFLPDNTDFAGPSDPDGTAGMRQWRDEHEPKEGNKRPYWPGAVEKKSFAIGG